MTDPWRAPTQVPATAVETYGTVMVTGHRPEKLSESERAWARVATTRAVSRLRYVYGARVAISGMAQGADTWFATAALAAGMDLHAYVPFESQAKRWSVEDREVWSLLRSHAAREVVVSDDGEAAWKYHARNDAMLEATERSSGLVVVVLRAGSSGGTAATYDKAARRKMPVLRLDPSTRATTREGW